MPLDGGRAAGRRVLDFWSRLLRPAALSHGCGTDRGGLHHRPPPGYGIGTCSQDRHNGAKDRREQLSETTEMNRQPLVFTALLFAWAAAPSFAADENDATAAIRLASQQYVAALERGDGESVAALWTEQGDLID